MMMHVKKYVTNPLRNSLLPLAKRIIGPDMAVDKLHFRNHVETWCCQRCNLYDIQELDGVSIARCSASRESGIECKENHTVLQNLLVVQSKYQHQVIIWGQ